MSDWHEELRKLCGRLYIIPAQGVSPAYICMLCDVGGGVYKLISQSDGNRYSDQPPTLEFLHDVCTDVTDQLLLQPSFNYLNGERKHETIT